MLLSSPLMGSEEIDLPRRPQEPVSEEIQQITNPQDLEAEHVHLQTLLKYIRSRKTNEAIDLIYQNLAPLDVPGEDGMFPIHWACRKGDLYMFMVLITKKPDQKSIRGKGGVTPLYCAALGGNTKIIQTLLDLGVGLDEQIGSGSTVFHGVCVAGKIGAAEFLLEKNPSMLVEKRKDGKTPLHAAVENKQKLMIEFLIKRLHIDVIRLSVVDKILWEKMGELLREEQH